MFQGKKIIYELMFLLIFVHIYKSFIIQLQRVIARRSFFSQN